MSGGDRLAIIDPGLPSPQAHQRIAEGLALLGAQLGDLRELLVTHAHRDHYPMAAHLRAAGHGRVAIGAAEKPSFDFVRDRVPGSPNRLVQLAQVAGAPSSLLQMMQRPDPGDPSDWIPPDIWLEPGQEVQAGDRRLRAIHTPGHTRGHFVFHDESAGVMFTGDHVLPHITPSIGFEAVSPRSPLQDFLTSLQLLREGPDAAMLPGHGVVGDSVHARVDELLAHHERRLNDTLAALRSGASTAYEVAGQLRWTGRERTLADLDLFNTMLATLETHWHLTLLVDRGVLHAQDDGSVRRYRE